MANFFDKFPKVAYNISGEKYSPNYQAATNIMFRFGFLHDVVSNASAYEYYTIRDGDTPESVANKYYGVVEAHWFVLLANQIYDPQYDWPLSSVNFDKYIVKKYGSIANAYTQMHHYEKITGRQPQGSDQFLFQTTQVDYAPLNNYIIDTSSYTGVIDAGDIFYQSDDGRYNTATFTAQTIGFSGSNNVIFLNNVTGNFVTTKTTYNYTKGGYIAANVGAPAFTTNEVLFPDLTVPHDYYVSLPLEPTTTTLAYDNGISFTEVTARRAVTCYDYEMELNESRRNIRLIRKSYYDQVMQEFHKLSGTVATYIRRVK